MYVCVIKWEFKGVCTSKHLFLSNAAITGGGLSYGGFVALISLCIKGIIHHKNPSITFQVVNLSSSVRQLAECM